VAALEGAFASHPVAWGDADWPRACREPTPSRNDSPRLPWTGRRV